MANKFRGVMQSPVTPLTDDFSPDLETFERLLDFHVCSGSPAISWPHHKGESLNLTIAERNKFAEAAVKVVAGRVPVALKSALRAMGRNVGEVRSPLQGLATGDRKKLTAALGLFAPLAVEPRGW